MKIEIHYGLERYYLDGDQVESQARKNDYTV